LIAQIQKKLIRFRRKKIFDYLQKVSTDKLLAMGHKRVVEAFHRARKNNPTYAKLLQTSGVKPKEIITVNDFCTKVPIIDKYDVFGDKRLSKPYTQKTISRLQSLMCSSGFSGTYSFGLSSAKDERATAEAIDTTLEHFFSIGTKKTLLISCLSMGVKVYSSVTLAEVSVRTDIALAIINEFAGYYDQILIIAEPYVAKKLLEEGVQQGVDWKKLQTSIITGGDWISESFRTYLESLAGISTELERHSMVIATMGLYIFTDPFGEAVGANFNIGDGYTVLSTFCWAFFLTFLDKYTKDDASFDYTIKLVFLQIVGSLLVITAGFLLMTAERVPEELSLSGDLWISVAFNGILASFVLMIIHTNYQRYTSPVKAALIFSLEPVFASIIALIFTTEVLNGRESVCAVLLFVGVFTSDLGGYLFRIKK